LFRQSIPPKELSKVHINYIQVLDVFEGEQRHGRIEWKLLIPFDQSSSMVVGKP